MNVWRVFVLQSVYRQTRGVERWVCVAQHHWYEAAVAHCTALRREGERVRMAAVRINDDG